MLDNRLYIGLTGGIGSGKSTVAQHFKAHGAGIVDADHIARDLLSTPPPFPELWQGVVEYFGPECLDEKGQLRRKVLRQRIFADPEARQWLEAKLHPVIRDLLHQYAKETPGPYVMAVIPLIRKREDFPWLDRILVIDCEEELQIQRTIQRDETSAEEVRNIIKTQLSRSERLTLADEVINNNGSEQELEPQIASLHQFYYTHSN